MRLGEPRSELRGPGEERERLLLPRLQRERDAEQREPIRVDGPLAQRVASELLGRAKVAGAERLPARGQPLLLTF